MHATTPPTTDHARAVRLLELVNRYGHAKFGDEWWPGAADAWLDAQDATELADLLGWVDSAPPPRPAVGELVAAHHAVVHVVTPSLGEAEARAHIEQVLSSHFLDWGYVRAFDPETGEVVAGEHGLQTPIAVMHRVSAYPGVFDAQD